MSLSTGYVVGRTDRLSPQPVIRTWVGEAVVWPEEFLETADRPHGAAVLFLGRVRASSQGRVVVCLRYEAYPEMAELELRSIAEEAAARFPIDEIRAAHRIGSLEPGETSVAISVFGPHRAPCYDASRFLIEEIKRRLPIWKREEYSDGTAHWVGGSAPERASSESQRVDEVEP
ncbi:MAG: molybdenum cofactor biosynthesis protein MoaE [Gemmatimonadota bacterium]